MLLFVCYNFVNMANPQSVWFGIATWLMQVYVGISLKDIDENVVICMLLLC